MSRVKLNANELVFCPLEIGDIDRLLEMQDEAFLTITDSSILRKNTYESLSVCFVAPSLVLGVFLRQELIAFGILLYAGGTKESLTDGIEGVNEKDGANVKLIIVKHAYRGNGLQRTILERLEQYARNNGTKFLCTTVSPNNVHSLNNLKSAGYKEIKRMLKYGGVKRCLMIKYLN